MSARHDTADGSPRPTPDPLALRRELIRRAVAEADGVRLRLPPEVRAHLGLVGGAHVLFALRDRGTVELIPLARVGVELLPMIEESEILAALRRQVARLHRRLAGVKRAAHAQGVCDGYHLGLRESFTARHGQAPEAQPGTRAVPAGGTAAPRSSP